MLHVEINAKRAPATNSLEPRDPEDLTDSVGRPLRNIDWRPLIPTPKRTVAVDRRRGA